MDWIDTQTWLEANAWCVEDYHTEKFPQIWNTDEKEVIYLQRPKIFRTFKVVNTGLLWSMGFKSTGPKPWNFYFVFRKIRWHSHLSLHMSCALLNESGPSQHVWRTDSGKGWGGGFKVLGAKNMDSLRVWFSFCQPCINIEWNSVNNVLLKCKKTAIIIISLISELD